MVVQQRKSPIVSEKRLLESFTFTENFHFHWKLLLKFKWNKRLVRPDVDSEGCKFSLPLNAKVI